MTIHNVGLGVKQDKRSLSNSLNESPYNISPVRVTRVILNEKDYPNLFKKLGEWGSLGAIFYDDIDTPAPTFIEENVAYPLFPHLKNYPLTNELVFIINLPSDEIYKSGGLTKSYYFSPINVWNNTHHNVIPDTIIPSEESFPKMGKTFKERDNIRGLLSFEGDIIHEGRWGQSIRFGSTVKNKNSWSNVGNEGDPITIIKNNHFLNVDGESWNPITEDINQDGSSIYFTSSQQIPINVSSKIYTSYNKPPTYPDQYSDPQIILNSDRILINSKSDSILLSSNKTISLSSKDTVNVDSKTLFTISSPKIYLGDKDATEPIVLGDKTVDLLGKILEELISVTQQLSILTSLPPGVPFAPLNLQATMSNNKLITYKNKLNTLLSKRNYTV